MWSFPGLDARWAYPCYALAEPNSCYLPQVPLFTDVSFARWRPKHYTNVPSPELCRAAPLNTNKNEQRTELWRLISNNTPISLQRKSGNWCANDFHFKRSPLPAEYNSDTLFWESCIIGGWLIPSKCVIHSRVSLQSNQTTFVTAISTQMEPAP